MKIVLYIIISISTLIVLFFTWFFLFYLKIPELNISNNISNEDRIQYIDKWFTELQKNNKFNGVVLISENGTPLLAKGYGFCNHKKNKLLTKDSSLRLASVSKQFTAAGIMVLHEQKKLSYNQRIKRNH